MRKVLFVQYVIAGLVAMFAMPTDAWAEITCNTNTGGPAILTINSVAPMPIDPDQAIGSVLASRSMYAERTGAAKVTCQGAPAEGIIGVWAGTTGPETGASTYATGIPGIGMRLTAAGNSLPHTDIYPKETDFAKMIQVKLEIIKTGTITRPGTLEGEVAQASFPDANNYQWMSIRLGGTLAISPQKPTCKVATTSVEAFLGKVHIREFSGIGSSSVPREFNIDLTCAGGHAAGLVAVAATITDTSNPLNRSDRLALTASSGAKGVAIQVLKDGNVLKFGPDSSVAGVINQWSAGQAGNGLFRIPLSARYLQTTTTITPGTANGRATFTISYP